MAVHVKGKGCEGPTLTKGHTNRAPILGCSNQILAQIDVRVLPTHGVDRELSAQCQSANM